MFLGARALGTEVALLLAGGGRSTAARSNQNMNFYTDDSPGLKISPVIMRSETLSFDCLSPTPEIPSVILRPIFTLVRHLALSSQSH